jgi:hypothetical protein
MNVMLDEAAILTAAQRKPETRTDSGGASGPAPFT